MPTCLSCGPAIMVKSAFSTSFVFEQSVQNGATPNQQGLSNSITVFCRRLTRSLGPNFMQGIAWRELPRCSGAPPARMVVGAARAVNRIGPAHHAEIECRKNTEERNLLFFFFCASRKCKRYSFEAYLEATCLGVVYTRSVVHTYLCICADSIPSQMLLPLYRFACLLVCAGTS